MLIDRHDCLSADNNDRGKKRGNNTITYIPADNNYCRRREKKSVHERSANPLDKDALFLAEEPIRGKSIRFEIIINRLICVYNAVSLHLQHRIDAD